MNKQDKIIVGLLFATLIAWWFWQMGVQKKAAEVRQRQERRIQAERAKLGPAGTETGRVDQAALATNQAAAAAASNAAPALVGSVPEAKPATPAVAAVPAKEHEKPEETNVLENAEAKVVLSSWGGGVTRVQLNQYREKVAKDSGPVQFDFSSKASLAFGGIPGLTTNDDFTLACAGNTATVERVTESGLKFTRTLSLQPGYRLSIVDTLANPGEQPMKIPAHSVALGAMRMIETKVQGDKGYYLEVDTLPEQSGQQSRGRVDSWGGDFFSKRFGVKSGFMGCGRVDLTGVPFEDAPPAAETALAWAAVKNKFFVQILAPESGTCTGYRLYAQRSRERPDFILQSISADMLFPEIELQPGKDLRREMSYYVGPKKYDLLKQLGNYQDMIMLKAWPGPAWGWYRVLCIWVLWTLNKLHGVIPDYGVAIILVTMIVRVIFWPVTHKGAQSMKKMQALQPLMADLKAKYKDNPQKMQQETMALYKKHKVNPMAGCLPMLVQMPVFIALFNVLRSAVELRFASFLWIGDLSEPEGLLDGLIPIAGSLNILPLLMTATSFLQNKLTPSSTDPQQKMMMNFMPLFMLFFFYKMASGLVLYWTVSQGLAIAQLAWQKYGKHAKKPA